MKKVKDFYFKEAKAKGFVARSAFKLEEIDQKNKIIKPGMSVMDLGCFPGSWLQYISKKIGNSGLVLGVDLQDLKLPLTANMRFIHSDINELNLESIREIRPFFDLICSDMAPKTSGIKGADADRSYHLCQLVLGISQQLLKYGGNTLMKVFQGAALEKLVQQMKNEYQVVKRIKPKSSRNESVEIFVLGVNKLKK
jgi:23S rRNA (uridine2552-2'-O)-methyltransferase